MAKKKDAKKTEIKNTLVLAKIKKLLSYYYERIGREDFQDWEDMTKEVLYKISEAIGDAKISAKALILAEMDRNEEEFEYW